VLLQSYYQALSQRFRQAGIENPALDARILLKSVLGLTDADFIGGNADIDTTPEVEDKIEELVIRRLAGEPLSKILGIREFWGLPFKVTKDVLDPRADTETIMEQAIRLFKDKPAPRRILDLGTGSGCLLISLLHQFPDATGIGVDISAAALAVAQENAHINNVADRARFLEGRWFEALAAESDAKFDLIVSNPPYIPSADIPNLEVNVRNHDPILALDGGNDGLDPYKIIFSQIKEHLYRHSFALFEFGIFQGPDIARLAGNAGLSVHGLHPDIAGILRVIEITSGEN